MVEKERHRERVREDARNGRWRKGERIHVDGRKTKRARCTWKVERNRSRGCKRMVKRQVGE